MFTRDTIRSKSIPKIKMKTLKIFYLYLKSLIRWSTSLTYKENIKEKVMISN